MLNVIFENGCVEERLVPDKKIAGFKRLTRSNLADLKTLGTFMVFGFEWTIESGQTPRTEHRVYLATSGIFQIYEKCADDLPVTAERMSRSIGYHDRQKERNR